MLKNIFLSALLLFTAAGYSSVASAEVSMTVLVTGANRGIGLELVRQMRARGHQVIGTARKPEQAMELKETGARVVQLDVTDSNSIRAMAEQLKGAED